MPFIRSAGVLRQSLVVLSITSWCLVSGSASRAAESRTVAPKKAAPLAVQSAPTPKPVQRVPRTFPANPKAAKGPETVALRTPAPVAPAPPEQKEDGLTRLIRVNGEWIRMPIVIREEP